MSVFKRGFMYRLSTSPSVTLYIAESKILAGKEERVYEGEAQGRKLAAAFFEDAPGPGGLVQRVDRSSLALKTRLLTIAEVLVACGVALPPDPLRTSAAEELLLEAKYQDLELRRFRCTAEPEAQGVHMFSLSDEDSAEAALALETSPDQRTKMVHARCLQRHDALRAGETLRAAWNSSLEALRARTEPFLAPPVEVPRAASAAVPLAASVAGKGLGRARRGPRGRRVRRGRR